MDQPHLAGEIKLLAQLKSDGALSEEQFERAKEKLLRRMSRRPGVAIGSDILWSFTGKLILIFVMMVLGVTGWGGVQIYTHNGELRAMRESIEKLDEVDVLRKIVAAMEARIEALSAVDPDNSAQRPLRAET